MITPLLPISIIACKKKIIVPVSPTTLSAVATSITQVNLCWTDNSTNETSFKIERNHGNNNYSIVAMVGADITHFNVMGMFKKRHSVHRQTREPPVFRYNSL